MTEIASSLDQIAARLKKAAEGDRDVSQMPLVTHEASGLTFRVSGMPRENYNAWHNKRQIEALKYESDGKKEKGFPLNRDESDLYLLQHAVFSEDGKPLTEELAKILLNGEDFGPSTGIVIEAAAKKNPPRQELTNEFQVMFGFSRGLVVLYRILEKADLLGLLKDRISPDDNVRQNAIADLETWLDTLPFWEGVLEAEDAARRCGISIYDAAEQNAIVAMMGEGGEDAG